MKGKILITDYVHNIMPERLQEMGFEVDNRPDISRKEVKAIIANYMGIVINSRMYMDKEMIDLGKKLKFIARLGSGLEIIDLEDAKNQSIFVFNSPEGNCNAVAEHIMGTLLALSNNILKADRELRSMIWDREGNRGWELKGKTIGIIGFGHTGSAFAEKLRGFGVDVLAYDKYKTSYAEKLTHVEETSINNLLTGSDIISLHVPLTDETHQLVSKKFLQKCKNGVVLINSSRGSVVDLEALSDALDHGKVKGACLDVFENEDFSSWNKKEAKLYQGLYERENVILTPHIAGWTIESKRNLSVVLLNKISKAFC